MNKKPEYWSWRKNEEYEWIGTFNSKKEAIKDAIGAIETYGKDISTIHLGRCEYIPIRTDVNVENILTDLEENYYDDTGYEAYLYDGVTDKQLEWLENKFSEVVEEFHKMANVKPRCFTVTDIEEVNVKRYKDIQKAVQKVCFEIFGEEK